MTRACPLCGGTECTTRNRTDAYRIVYCDVCGFIYLQNPPDESEIYEEFWGEDTELRGSYDQDAAEPSLREVYSINRSRIKWLEAFPDNGRLLDLGCGNGFFLTLAREAGFEVYGQEISENAQRYAEKNFGLQVFRDPLESLAVEQVGRYDIVTLWHVLEHIINPLEALKLVGTLLKPGGLLVVEVPNVNSLKFQLSGWRWEGGNHPRYHRSFFDRRSLRRALAKSGFTDLHRRRLSYRIQQHSAAYHLLKQGLNLLSRDAFLLFTGRRPD